MSLVSSDDGFLIDAWPEGQFGAILFDTWPKAYQFGTAMNLFSIIYGADILLMVYHLYHDRDGLF